MNDRIILVDAYAQIYRCFYAIRADLSDAQGNPTNALFGIARLLLQLDKSLPSSHGAFVFDKGKPTERVEICPEYKAQRPPMPDRMRPQIPLIRDWILAFGWSIVEQEGLEADDLIAAITRRRNGLPVQIVTHDKDITQLTADNDVILTFPEKGDKWVQMGAKEVQEKYGVAPSQIAEYLAIVGDTADNIIGISGVGPKRAAKMLQQFGSIDNILLHADEAGGKTLGPILKESADLLHRNLQLTQLKDTLPDGYTETPRRNSPDWTKLLSLAQNNGFHSLLAPLEKQRAAAQQPELLF